MKYTGFTLIENLAALVVLSIGVLGSGALLANALTAMRASTQQQTAIVLADDMRNRLQASNSVADPVANESIDIAGWRGEIARRLPGGLGRLTLEPRGVALVRDWILQGGTSR